MPDPSAAGSHIRPKCLGVDEMPNSSALGLTKCQTQSSGFCCHVRPKGLRFGGHARPKVFQQQTMHRLPR